MAIYLGLGLPVEKSNRSTTAKRSHAVGSGRVRATPGSGSSMPGPACDNIDRIRARDVIGDAAFQAVEEELDLLEVAADPRISPA